MNNLVQWQMIYTMATARIESLPALHTLFTEHGYHKIMLFHSFLLSSIICSYLILPSVQTGGFLYKNALPKGKANRI